jgi:hypothetical protein
MKIVPLDYYNLISCRVPSEGGTGGEAENGEEEKETDRAFEVGSRA